MLDDPARLAGQVGHGGARFFLKAQVSAGRWWAAQLIAVRIAIVSLS